MRKALLPTGFLLLCIVTVEFCSFIALSVVQREPMSQSDVAASYESAREQIYDPTVQGRVIHPYMGYVINQNGPDKLYGLPIHEEGALTKSSDTVIVGIIGGSVAKGIASGEAWQTLQHTLLSSPEFKGKNIQLVPLAIAGYRQPQQLQVLSYLISLGAEFDVLLNLDGFMEIQMSNIFRNQNQFPFFPEVWPNQVSSLDPSNISEKVKMQSAMRRQRTALSVASSFPFKYSYSVALLWKGYNAQLLHTIEQAHRAINLSRAKGVNTYKWRGPWQDRHLDDDVLLQDVADVWRRSSLAMHHLSEANDILYIHFLQPNQYVEGSKPMGEQEKAIALGRQGRFAEITARGYELLREEGRALKEASVHYFDLTQIFNDVPEQMYKDSCCHHTPEGYAILAETMARKVIELYGK